MQSADEHAMQSMQAITAASFAARQSSVLMHDRGAAVAASEPTATMHASTAQGSNSSQSEDNTRLMTVGLVRSTNSDRLSSINLELMRAAASSDASAAEASSMLYNANPFPMPLAQPAARALADVADSFSDEALPAAEIESEVASSALLRAEAALEGDTLENFELEGSRYRLRPPSRTLTEILEGSDIQEEEEESVSASMAALQGGHVADALSPAAESAAASDGPAQPAAAKEMSSDEDFVLVDEQMASSSASHHEQAEVEEEFDIIEKFEFNA